MKVRLLSRKAVALSWEGSGSDAAEKIFLELKKTSNLNEEISLQIEKAHESLQTRISSLPQKVLKKYKKTIIFILYPKN